MKKNHTEIIFVVDRSGSMSGKSEFVVSSFNNFIEKEKEVPGTANVTLRIFDDEHDVIYTSVPLGKVKPLTEADFKPRNMTALRDAIGLGIDEMEKVFTKRAKKNRPEKVLMIIITDGMENASNEYTESQLANKIKNQKEKNWQFAFLGTKEANVIRVAKNLNIDMEFTQQVSFDSMADTQVAYASANTMSRAYRTGEYLIKK